ncbi:helix-turn-helix domain-containing protein [Peribacillus butanolivorans]|uniref:helix-turn-helix domain-containing protein n=1 Tax=Peribacillus butanolivorans TaxID=421767 RepID=UPI00207D5AA0|nr:helix-turn-helix domain-containing protein [Peribacillus butanolivorans]MCO0600272.1 helix-turn-helix domain-containing protein [Peribacillus butanolivorans]
MITTEYPSILKVKDIQNILRIGQRQTYDLVKTEDFKTIRLGNRQHYSKEHFIKWLEGKGK